jgi:hypothetical protein
MKDCLVNPLLLAMTTDVPRRGRAVEFYFFDLESGCVGALRATPAVFVSNDDRRALFATPLRRHASILVEKQNSIALQGEAVGKRLAILVHTRPR